MAAILVFQNGRHLIQIWPYFCLWSPFNLFKTC